MSVQEPLDGHARKSKLAIAEGTSTCYVNVGGKNAPTFALKFEGITFRVVFKISDCWCRF